MNIVITGGAGRIAYSLVPLICKGDVFGSDVKVRLRLLDIEPALGVLQGVVMEIEDSNYPSLLEVIGTTDPAEAFADADVVIMLGGYPRKAGMERKDLISMNAAIIKIQADALEKYAKKNVKVLVVANPANTNCLIAIKSAPSIPQSNFSCLIRLDHERLVSAITKKLNSLNLGKVFTSSDVSGVTIFGNHSTTQVPHIDDAKVFFDNAWLPLDSFIQDPQWQYVDLTNFVQNRGGDIIRAQKASSGMSAAIAIAKHLTSWIGPITNENNQHIFSHGMLSNGVDYNIPADLVFSFPCVRNADGSIEVVRDLNITSPQYQEMIRKTVQELEEEKADAYSALQI